MQNSICFLVKFLYADFQKILHRVCAKFCGDLITRNALITQNDISIDNDLWEWNIVSEMGPWLLSAVHLIGWIFETEKDARETSCGFSVNMTSPYNFYDNFLLLKGIQL